MWKYSTLHTTSVMCNIVSNVRGTKRSPVYLLVFLMFPTLHSAYSNNFDIRMGDSKQFVSNAMSSVKQNQASLNGHEALAALSILNNSIANDHYSGTIGICNVSNLLIMMGMRGITPTLEFADLHNITKAFTEILERLLRQNVRRPAPCMSTGKKALSSLFRSVEMFVQTLAVHQLKMEEHISLYFKEDHIEIGLLLAEEHRVEVTQNLSTAVLDVDFPVFVRRERSVGVILYKGLNGFLREYETCVTSDGEETRTFGVIGSDILSTSVYALDDDGKKITNITMTFTLKNLHDNTTVTCAYWKFADGTTSGGYWLADGCFIADRHNYNVTCVCNHLTNFALLVQVSDFELSAVDQKALSIISYAGCSVSITGALLSVFVFLFLRICQDRVLIHLNLALAIVGAQAVFVFEETVPRHTPACILVMVLMYYFHMAVFCWMLCEGIHLYLTVVVVFASRDKMRRYHFLGWGCPLLVVAVGTAIVNSNIGKHDVCWFSPKDKSILVFVIPAMSVALVNVGILVEVMRVVVRLSRTSIDNRLERIRKTAKASVLLLPLLGGTWLLGVFALSQQTVVFQYLFALTNSTQGLLLFLCHCVTSSEVRQAFARKKHAWELNRRLLRLSKVSPASMKSMGSNELATIAMTEVSKTSSSGK